MSKQDIIKIGDYVNGNVTNSQGEITSFSGFVNFIALSHIELHTGFIVSLIPQKYFIEKVDNVTSIKHWQQNYGLLEMFD